MDLSKLNSNEKIAAIGAVLAIVGSARQLRVPVPYGVLTGIAMLAIIFLPQFSPRPSCPARRAA